MISFDDTVVMLCEILNTFCKHLIDYNTQLNNNYKDKRYWEYLLRK